VAVNARTLALFSHMRIELAGTVDRVTQDLVYAWAVAWNELIPEWTAALEALIEASDGGRWPSPAQVARASRAQQALAITSDALDQLAQTARLRILSEVPTLTDAAAHWQARLIAGQYPDVPGHAAVTGVTFDRVDRHQLAAIVKRVTERVTALTQPLSAQATQALKATLVRGIAVGEHPSVVASRMLNRVGGAFDGGRNRALVLARTEMLDAHRSGAREQNRANRDVLRGWQWVATLDKRTCPACWSMHGQTFGVDVSGPNGHQQCRCAAVPLTRSWKDLGFPDIDEPASLLPDAEQTFRALPREDQQAIMTPKRLELLDSSKVSWSDLATKQSNAGWRDSYVPTPLSVLAA
jgi:SPP1 gp7 family putative phage head morphogenesis protein